MTRAVIATEKGDIEVEGHHTIEDTAIVLGQAARSKGRLVVSAQFAQPGGPDQYGSIIPKGSTNVGAINAVFTDLKDIEEVRVAHHGGVPVTVKDVAAVRVGYAPRQGIVSRGHDEDVVEGIVLLKRDANATEVLEGFVVAKTGGAP